MYAFYVNSLYGATLKTTGDVGRNAECRKHNKIAYGKQSQLLAERAVLKVTILAARKRMGCSYVIVRFFAELSNNNSV